MEHFPLGRAPPQHHLVSCMAALSSNLASLFPTVVIFGEAGLEASFSLALLELLPCGLVVAPDARLAHTWGGVGDMVTW